MDFFTAQARARTKTHRLVILFLLAVFGVAAAAYTAVRLIYSQGQSRSETFVFWDAQTALVTLLVVIAVTGIGAWVKWAQLSAGGASVAKMLGGRPISPSPTDAAERRLANIVEEMSISAGIPVPQTFVLDDEPAINAFAAGLTTSDAVVAVSRGALENLSRDELQAVVGHEFSHILNGDMRMNIKLASIIFGILAFVTIGRVLFYSLRFVRTSSSSKKNGTAVALAFIILTATALIIIGSLGYFFGRLIQCAISRQREFLADASSVQFTRNPDAMANALNRIRINASGSAMQNSHAAEIGHFFFAQGISDVLSSWFATHPPLPERIKAIMPQFDFSSPDQLHSRPPTLDKTPLRPAPPSQTARSIVASIGSLNAAKIGLASQITQSLPQTLHSAARTPALAPLVILCLLLEKNPELLARQGKIINLNALPDSLKKEVSILNPLQRLPLLQIALGSLNALPAADQDMLMQSAQSLADADGRLSIFEYALLHLLRHHIASLRNPRRASALHHLPHSTLASATSIVLSFVARAGKSLHSKPEDSFQHAARTLPQLAGKLYLLPETECNLRRLDDALDLLAHISPAWKQIILHAAATAATTDGTILPSEAELLRVIACSLDCPMPPL
ncbi:MAG: M48 family metallopeptidase [Puniceicoccales bacterium]|jgi:Zn-dependent protease with chaperone function|nr:M48 family metallopeptidase [Puniceicoccales bacterium]